MIDERKLREMLERRARTISATPTDAPKAVRRARRRLALNAAVGTLVGLAVLAGAFAGFRTIQAAPTPADRPTPSVTTTPSGTVQRRDGEVITSEAGRLVAVDPDTAESRIIVADDEQTKRRIGNAAWSPDGRWVAYDLIGGSELWVVNAEREPRQLAVETSYGSWTWSPTAPQLAMVRDSRLTVVDASTGRQTDLGSVVGDDTSAPVWSPDGTRILYGVRGGSLYSVDVGSGDRSLLVRLPGEDLDSMDQIEWSPDGAYLAIVNDLEPGGGRLYVMNADGSRVRVLLDNFEPGGAFGTRFGWSPDGTRLAYAALSGPDERSAPASGAFTPELLIWTVSLDGSAPSLVASHTNDGCQLTQNRSFTCEAGGSPVWSPDGSQIAFETSRSSWHVRSTPPSPAFVINSDGTGDLRTIDELMYLSWSGGSYHCECYG
jgi:Tol biopolymer transport system component